jgi:serine/threonine-protein kinase
VSDVLERLKTALADRYSVERELGSGGMAVVYLAQDLRHERPVAIKVLRPELMSVVAAERFLREIKLTAGLAHPHILPVLDSGEADGVLYYVMPYVEGESLRDRLNREKQLPIDESVRIAREVADALSTAHKHNLLHRDIKPENILLQADHAVVADFGIAKALSAAAGDRLTDTGISIGTPAYMSPEQAAGEREITEASDLYSLACVLYEMLTGEPPIADASLQKVVSRKMLGDFRPAREVCPEIPRVGDRQQRLLPGQSHLLRHRRHVRESPCLLRFGEGGV